MIVGQVVGDGWSLEAALANGVVIAGFIAAALRLCYSRAKREFKEGAEKFIRPTNDAVEALAQAVLALKGRIEQLEAERVTRDEK